MLKPVAVINLLKELLKNNTRQNKSFDKYKVAFLSKLQKSPSDKITGELFEECTEQLSKLDIPLEETLSEGRLLVSQSQLQLQKQPSISESIINKIEQSKAIPRPYSVIEHHHELTSIIKIYQRVINQLSDRTMASGDDAKGLFDEFNKELQQLIINLDIDDAYIKKIKTVCQKVVCDHNMLELPQHCMRIIAIVVESTHEERLSSRHFLFTLNDNMAQFHLDFSNNIKKADSVFEDQVQCIKKIQKKSERLKNKAQQENDFASLQVGIFSYIESVEQLIHTTEQEKQTQVFQKFHSMAREIKELQNQTKHFQNTVKKQHKQLNTDFLTKIPNRSAWNERLQIEFIRYQRYHHPLNLAVIDIDKFKKINDTFGHLAGDKVVTVIAQSLQQSLRNVDFIARYGGDEFVVLLPDTNQEQAQVVLGKLCERIRKIPFKFKKESIRITISIGCTSFCENDDIDSAFERADQALFHAKESGRDQFFNN